MAHNYPMRLPESLYDKLVEEAKAEGISLNSYLIYIISSRQVAKKAKPLGKGKSHLRKSGE